MGPQGGDTEILFAQFESQDSNTHLCSCSSINLKVWTWIATKERYHFVFQLSEQKLMCKQEQNLAMSLLALPVRERFGNDVVLILSHILQDVHEMLL